MKCKEYKARMVQKDGEKFIFSFTTWRGDIIENIIRAVTFITSGTFKRGDDLHIEIVPYDRKFVHVSKKEMGGRFPKLQVVREEKVDEDYVIIKLKKPVRNEYHLGLDCAPKQRGDGCHGDCICMDCHRIDEERYERISKFQASQQKLEGKLSEV